MIYSLWGRVGIERQLGTGWALCKCSSAPITSHQFLFGVSGSTEAPYWTDLRLVRREET